MHSGFKCDTYFSEVIYYNILKISKIVEQLQKINVKLTTGDAINQYFGRFLLTKCNINVYRRYI